MCSIFSLFYENQFRQFQTQRSNKICHQKAADIVSFSKSFMDDLILILLFKINNKNSDFALKMARVIANFVFVFVRIKTRICTISADNLKFYDNFFIKKLSELN